MCNTHPAISRLHKLCIRLKDNVRPMSFTANDTSICAEREFRSKWGSLQNCALWHHAHFWNLPHLDLNSVFKGEYLIMLMSCPSLSHCVETVTTITMIFVICSVLAMMQSTPGKQPLSQIRCDKAIVTVSCQFFVVKGNWHNETDIQWQFWSCCSRFRSRLAIL